MNDTLTRARVGLFACLWLVATAASAWWHEDWTYRKTVAIDPSAIAAAPGLSGEVVVPVRLHHGNFPFFLDMRDDGGDLRFIAADDVTPLPFHIESYDRVLGMAVVWVRVPLPAAPGGTFYMYYGNAEAVSASEPARTYAADTALAMHFAEAAGAPLDSTAFGHHAVVFSGTPAAPGQIGTGAQFDPAATMTVAPTPALALDSDRGTSVAFWVRLAEDQIERAALLKYGTATEGLDVSLEANRIVPEIYTADALARLESDTSLVVGRWHHIGLTLDGETLTLTVDGRPAGQATVPAFTTPDAALVVGARSETAAGFAGTLDELNLVNRPLSPAAFAFARAAGDPDAGALTFGEDESRRAGGGMREYFDLILSLSSAIRIEGWAIIVLLAAIGIAAIDVIVTKAFSVRRQERADDAFLSGFRRQSGTDLAETASVPDEVAKAYGNSGAFRIYQAGVEEFSQLAEAGQTRLDAAGIEVVRAGMEAQLVAETDRLNSRLVLLTLGVSGGPFLGLLGTVLGVMVTFATIARAGDVNVNTIAPGVAAALTTTVMGLVVAIPSLFGYNYVAGRIARRVTAMEVFIDQFITKLARGVASQTHDARESLHAA